MPPLLPEHVQADPVGALTAWVDEARATDQPQATAMALATAGLDGRPSVRMVFLREWGPRGVAWLTDGHSGKARDISERADVAGVIFWAGLGRQVRIEGTVRLMERGEVDAMFARRRPETRAAAWAWYQGEPLETRADLIRRLATARADDLPDGAPPAWIGHRLEPRAIEFWQEDPDGLHDRLLARRSGTGWTVRRLAP
jgi:pyridoxamine 5'-phosphate oxidase